MSKFKLIWEGKPSDIHINSGGPEGVVARHSHREWKKNRDNTYEVTEIFDEFFIGFQGDTTIWGSDERLISQVESSCEFYDYDLWVPSVVKIETDDNGDLHLTIPFCKQSEDEECE